MHESFEAPGALLQWTKKNNFSVTYTRLYAGDKFPMDVDSFDFLIIMWWPQCPATTLEECPHFDAQKEIQFIRNAITHDKLVLWICLWAQLIGEALWAKFVHSPHREIGVFDIQMNQWITDSVFSSFPAQFSVAHWHGDMPWLTHDSVLLASSAWCPRQIVKYTDKVYGFQCHFEFTSESVEEMITHCGHELETYKDSPYIRTKEMLRTYQYDTMNALLFTFLDALQEKYAK
jgi:GMP synthase (glutamine-hydrolysing)